MFWRVPGYSNHSPLEGILDREDYTLEDLLDEEDLVQECKSLNSRLVAFLREQRTVERLIRYLVEPQDDSTDPKRAFKYPFTSCEVLCCELEAVYNTMLEPELLHLLFSFLDSPAQSISSMSAGYFGRVVGNLLLRKSSEMLEYLQGQGPDLLVKLVKHVATTSIADVMKRMVGADDQSSLMPSPAMAQWLAETPLVDLLLDQLDENNTAESQMNAADILSATAHTQPSALAARLTEPSAVAALLGHALSPGRQVLIPALDVCIALLEPRRAVLGDALGMSVPGHFELVLQARSDAVMALVQHVPRVVGLLNLELSNGGTQDTSFGRLAPPLGRHRLKVVELLAALVRSGNPAAEQAVMQSSALPQCMDLFASYPFNNMLHHSVATMLVTCMTSCSDMMARHLVEECKVLDWIISLPFTVVPMPRPGDEQVASAKAPLRAGYMGHVTQISLALVGHFASSESDTPRLTLYVLNHPGWRQYLQDVVLPQQELENTSAWQCGRPATHTLPGMESDGEDFSNFDESIMADLEKAGESDKNPWGEDADDRNPWGAEDAGSNPWGEDEDSKSQAFHHIDPVDSPDASNPDACIDSKPEGNGDWELWADDSEAQQPTGDQSQELQAGVASGTPTPDTAVDGGALLQTTGPHGAREAGPVTKPSLIDPLSGDLPEVWEQTVF